MLIKKTQGVRPSEITDKSVYLQRRRFVRAAVEAGVLAAGGGLASMLAVTQAGATLPAGKLGAIGKSDLSTDEPLTPYKSVTTYNNFYEFGTDKDSPAKYAGAMKPRPWSVIVEGECEKPGTHDVDDIIKRHPLEERVYRLRCVEAWSMVIPWVGFPLGAVLTRFAPTSRAKYVEFTTLYDPKQMPGQRRAVLDWPYVEALRMDEAMHPLTIMAVGLYGDVLPNQNGAPLRLVVPWKYGFKSIKSIVKIRFTEQQPATTWAKAGPDEYGFYSNVNPEVDHPRWSQNKERRLGRGLFSPKIETQMFNGYADQVAHLYAGMDLRKHY